MRESVRIAYTYIALNELQNYYLQALCSEKKYITCGIEWGLKLVGRKSLIARALYGPWDKISCSFIIVAYRMIILDWKIAYNQWWFVWPARIGCTIEGGEVLTSNW